MISSGKYGIVIAVMVVMWSPLCNAQPYRNIFSATYLDYAQGDPAKIFENAFVARVASQTSILVKAYHSDRGSWNNTIISAGPVINLNRYHYLECTYGYGFDSNDREAHYLTAELTREKPGYLVMLGYRHGKYPGYSFNVLSPGVRYYLTNHFSLWGKYFASLDSDKNYDQAYWIEGEYRFTSRVVLKLGTTGGNRLYSPEYEYTFGGHSDMRFHSILGQIGYSFNEKLSVRYQYENMVRQSKYTDKVNTLLVDARF